MPVHHYGLSAKHDRTDLVDALAADLRAEHQGRPIRYDPSESAPQIYIDESSATDKLRVYVVWSAWHDVPEIQRPGIILDAFEKAGLKSQRRDIALAMGLTPEEADALGARD